MLIYLRFNLNLKLYYMSDNFKSKYNKYKLKYLELKAKTAKQIAKEKKREGRR